MSPPTGDAVAWIRIDWVTGYLDMLPADHNTVHERIWGGGMWGELLSRSRRSAVFGVLIGLIALAAASGVLAGCGGDSTTVTVTAEETSESSSDASELGDELEAELEEEEEGGSDEPGGEDCSESEVSNGEFVEGTCTENGSKFVVVNMDSTLKLKTLEAKLENIDLKKTISDLGESETANGVFVVFTLKITNIGRAPAEFEESQTTLLISEKLYTPDFEVQNGFETQSFLWQGEQIQPLGNQRGTITFDVPKQVAADLTKTGNLDIINFGTSSFGGEENFEQDEIGTIRTYK
jgi:Domain of unknown function (DUF4352)